MLSLQRRVPDGNGEASSCPRSTAGATMRQCNSAHRETSPPRISVSPQPRTVATVVDLPCEDPGAVEIGVHERLGFADHLLDFVLARPEPCSPHEVRLRCCLLPPDTPVIDLRVLLAAVQLQVRSSELQLLPPVAEVGERTTRAGSLRPAGAPVTLVSMQTSSSRSRFGQATSIW